MDEDIQKFGGMSVNIGNSRELGSCNACRQYMTPSGCRYHTVYVISFDGLLFRVCLKCAAELKQKLS